MFLLKRFKIEHKGNILYDCEFNLQDSIDRQNIFTSIIVGENGVGKSYLLKLIADFFSYASTESKVKFKYDIVKLIYFMNNDSYEINKEFNKLLYLKNDILTDLSYIIFPNKILALSFMVNDKFTYSNQLDKKYLYLGVRAISNATYTSSIQKRLVNSILNSINDNLRISSMAKTLDAIDLKQKVDIFYKLKRKTLFTSKINYNILSKKLNKIKRNKEFIAHNELSEIESSLFVILDFIQELKYSEHNAKDGIIFELLFDKKNNISLLLNVKLLGYMEKLDLLENPEVKFTKNNLYDFEYTSSGEKHFIHTMINLVANIEEDSLILIDEPELSLHPRWQMKYIKTLKDLLKYFKSAHCILASHSHFMVSDIMPECSSLITLLKEYDASGKEFRKSELIPYSTYAWSAENILYKVFNLRTSRNYYFEQDLAKLLQLIASNSDNIQQIRELHDKLSHFIFDGNDPINKILFQAKQYLEQK